MELHLTCLDKELIIWNSSSFVANDANVSGRWCNIT